MYQFTMTEMPESPASDIQQHRDKLSECVDDICDILTEYVEEDVLTPGEFVKCFRDALQRMGDYHKSRNQLLEDCESLLLTKTDG
jgi:uncharacterized protein Yka (UPF0111/DUF47 family)